MSLLLIAVGVFLLWYLVARLFPITLTAVILIFGALVYVIFAQHHELSEATANVYAWIIMAAFYLDIVCAALTKPFARN